MALFLPEGCDRCEVTLASYPALHVIRRDVAALALAQFDVEHVCYGFESVNCALVDAVKRVWPHARQADFNPVEAMRASKTPAVLDRFRDAFARSSAAIAETMRWAKAGEPGTRHTEYDLARTINDAYGARSAVALTFPSIAANGEQRVRALHRGERRRRADGRRTRAARQRRVLRSRLRDGLHPWCCAGPGRKRSRSRGSARSTRSR